MTANGIATVVPGAPRGEGGVPVRRAAVGVQGGRQDLRPQRARVAPPAGQPQVRAGARGGTARHLSRDPAGLPPQQAPLGHDHPRRVGPGRDAPASCSRTATTSWSRGCRPGSAHASAAASGIAAAPAEAPAAGAATIGPCRSPHREEGRERVARATPRAAGRGLPRRPRCARSARWPRPAPTSSSAAATPTPS